MKEASKKDILPITVKYSDKVDLIRKLLDIYSKVKEKLTKRNTDLLTLCMIYGLNSPEFRKTIVEGKLYGFTNEKHINTELSRLRKRGFVYKDKYNKQHLGKGLERIEQLVNSKEKQVYLYLQYERG